VRSVYQAAISVYLIQLQTESLLPPKSQQKETLFTAISLPGAFAAMFFNPIIGALSDRWVTPGKLGKRYPYIITGALCHACSFCLLALSSRWTHENSETTTVEILFPLLSVLMLFDNLFDALSMAPYSALIPEYVPKSQFGAASGWMGLASMLGNLFGAVGTGLLVDYLSLSSLYLLQAFMFFVGAFLTLLSNDPLKNKAIYLYEIQQQQLNQQQNHYQYQHQEKYLHSQEDETDQKVKSSTISSSLSFSSSSSSSSSSYSSSSYSSSSSPSSYSSSSSEPSLSFKLEESTRSHFDRSTTLWEDIIGAGKEFIAPFQHHAGFLLVFLSRFFYNLAFNIMSGYFIFFLENLVGGPFHFFGLFTLQSLGLAMALFMLLFLVGSVASSLLSGVLSDKYGRKKLVYISVASQVLATSAFLWTSNYGLIAGVMAPLCGAGYGAYVSVDWALASDALLRSKDLARDMGIWHLSFSAASVVGYPLAGFLMSTFRDLGDALGISLLGYKMVVVLVMLFFSLGGILIYPIRFPHSLSSSPSSSSASSNQREELDDLSTHHQSEEDQTEPTLPLFGDAY
jgi:MFS family permease